MYPVRTCCATRGCSRRTDPLHDSVDHPGTSSRELLRLAELEPAAPLRRGEERLPLAGNQRVDNDAQLVDQPGIDQARRRLGASDQIDALAGLLLESSNVIESSKQARVRPAHRGHRARKNVMRGLRG